MRLWRIRFSHLSSKWACYNGKTRRRARDMRLWRIRIWSDSHISPASEPATMAVKFRTTSLRFYTSHYDYETRLQRSSATFSDRIRSRKWLGRLGRLGGVLSWWNGMEWNAMSCDKEETRLQDTQQRRFEDLGSGHGQGWAKIPAISINNCACDTDIRFFHGHGHSYLILQRGSGERRQDVTYSVTSLGSQLQKVWGGTSWGHDDLKEGVMSWFQPSTPCFPIGPSAAWPHVLKWPSHHH